MATPAHTTETLAPTGAPPRLLVVEDDGIVACDIGETLASLGYGLVGTVSSGEDALALARTQPIDLAVMDIELAGHLDGVHTAELLRARHGVPSVYLTVHSDDATLQRVASCHCYGYVVKPFNAQRLRSTVQLALRSFAREVREDESRRWLTRSLEQRILTSSSQVEYQRAQTLGEREANNAELAGLGRGLARAIRAPVRRLGGFCRALVEDAPQQLGPDGVRNLARIQAASDQIGLLMGGLDRLVHVIQSDFRPEVVDVSRVVADIQARLAQQQPRRHVDFTVQGGIEVFADRNLMLVLMENLLDNAWKFTAGVPEPKVEFSAFQGDGLMVCTLRDNGVGFEDAATSSVFDAFARPRDSEAHAGVGVGLAIAQRIVRRHGGRIWVETKRGHGASVHFVLSASFE